MTAMKEDQEDDNGIKNVEEGGGSGVSSLTPNSKQKVDDRVMADVFEQFNNSLGDMKGFGSEDLKKDNPGHNSFTDSHGLPVGIHSPKTGGKAKLSEDQIQDLFVKRMKEKRQVQEELQEKQSIKFRAGTFARRIYRSLSGESSSSKNAKDYKSKYGNLEAQKQHQLDILKRSLGPELENDININHPTTSSVPVNGNGNSNGMHN